jgi:hypothetical protein
VSTKNFNNKNKWKIEENLKKIFIYKILKKSGIRTRSILNF